ncbi:zinc finger CCHC domain-containing protein 10-like [Cynara cardunculus var. scolymus]|uniref:Zinc finger, CCHC-type n=1 Tax=Cynara cardunculus var. scolymus TaxID=59895 RepID=A0A124SBC6_CYNCS|nr:zinc finger CCHC domain-containing protein 10-like [Cynara cardunculus var. scolymus]KVH90206.1 Zinc finger, CCHC-type [Cynara cardunculus var. scolymus]
MSEKMKAAALSATKGLSRVQAERAAANATRNVNAYGQKEEGPSRWQEKKEAKTQMYLKSTEKQATLNEKKCQKCRKTGHWTYECQKQAPETPKLDIRTLMSQDLNGVDTKKEEKAERSSKKEKNSKRKNRKRKHRSRSTSESSDSESDHEDGGSRRKKKKHSRRSNRDR